MLCCFALQWSRLITDRVFANVGLDTMPYTLLFAYVFLLWLTTANCCRRYLYCDTGRAGFGDQLEHYVHCLYCSTLLNATLAIDGFRFGPANHRGSAEYRSAAVLLGVDFTTDIKQLHALSLNRTLLSFDQVLSLSEDAEFRSGIKQCDVLFQTDICSCRDSLQHVCDFPPSYSSVRAIAATLGKKLSKQRCKKSVAALQACLPVGSAETVTGLKNPVHNWCDFRPSYNSLQAVMATLRDNVSKQVCRARRLGFTEQSCSLKIVWHVRTGDICPRCGDSAYFKRLYSALLRVPQIGRNHELYIESQHPVTFLESVPLFRSAKFSSNSSLLQSVCKFLTADLLLTTGSSFSPFVAAFAPQWSPILFEERRKEAKIDSKFPHHFFHNDSAILLEDGAFKDFREDQLVAFLKTLLLNKKTSSCT